MILTEIGEIGVFAADAEVILRPSLYAMSRLGDPAEIINIYISVMSDPAHTAGLKVQWRDAIAVLYACTDKDISALFGYHEADGAYTAGVVPTGDILPLARCLLKHGVTGALPPRPNKEGNEYVNEFNARSHVGLAMAHLGMSEREAWDLTMTGLVLALYAKFPEDTKGKGNKSPSEQDYEKTMAWLEKVDAKRKAAKKVR